jgi:GTP-binding protein HflX
MSRVGVFLLRENFVCDMMMVQVFEERAYLVGLERKGTAAAAGKTLFSITESLEELSQLADTAGLAVVGSTYQK